MNNIERCLRPYDYDASVEKLRNEGRPTIQVWYGSQSASKDLAYLNTVVEKVRADYPDIKEEEMQVYMVFPHEAKHHQRKLGVLVSRPLEEVLKLKTDEKVRCL